MRRTPITGLLTALAAAGCSGASASDPNARPFRVGLADHGEIRVIVEETGIVEPERQVVVKSPISGIVEQLLVREGARVAAGQLLARVAPDLAQANTIARLRSDLISAEIARDRLEREFGRARDLIGRGGVTQQEYDEREAALEQARNNVHTAREQLRFVEQSGVSAADTTQRASITAPAGGVVIARGVEEGETVVGGTSAFGGGTEMFTIADLSALRVKAAINEVDIGKVSLGDSVALSVDAFPDDTVVGIVRLVPPAARLQERVRVFDVEIRALTTGVLRPGMTANVRIKGPVRDGVVRVPVESVFLHEGRTTVFRLRGGDPERVPVRLGLGDLAFVEVLEGLAPGDSVALEDPIAALERARRISR